ncbi:hypothetical protein [Streptobacillus moniliformis]|uniref:hypothetical protein n=1 Tax=Streptobacillus moniliformis TaxID=34105 RepID=UPI0007E43B4B|nr:hypothetical protein [Streptobacillus moniliformis]
MLDNRKMKIQRLENELKELKKELGELIKNQIELPIKLDINGTDGLKEEIPRLKQEYLKGNIDIDTFIELLGSKYTTIGFTIGHQETLNICEYEANIEKKEKELKFLKYKTNNKRVGKNEKH